jgi:MYXO-CTERM domain-containing protein
MKPIDRQNTWSSAAVHVLLATCLWFTASGLAVAATITYQQGAAAVSADAGINLPSYTGTEDTMLWDWGFNQGTWSSYGSDASIWTSTAQTGLLRFDVSSLTGQYVSINSVKLVLNPNFVDGASGNTAIHRLAVANASWVAGGGAYPNTTITGGSSSWGEIHTSSPFNCFGGNQWAGGACSGARVIGTDVESVPLASVAAGGLTQGVPHEFSLASTSLDATALIDDWTTGVNSGLAIINDGAPNLSNVDFDSAQSQSANLRPQLMIDFEPLPVPGDANGDRLVDAADLAIVLAHWSTGDSVATGDFNGDDTVDVADLSILAGGSPSPAVVGVGQLASTPEPTSFSLAALGLLGILGVGRRRRRRVAAVTI